MRTLVLKQLAFVLGFLAVVGPAATGSGEMPSLTIDDLADRFGDHCFDCHGYGETEGGFNFETLASGGYGDDTLGRWEALWHNVRAETMPPADAEAPDPSIRAQWISWIQSDVFNLSPDAIDPGHVTLRRLNRREYQKSINALTGQWIEVSELLPADDTGYGFDTIGAALTLSPVVLEKYIAAARQVTDMAVPSGGPSSPIEALWGNGWSLDRPDSKPEEASLAFDQRRVLFRKINLKRSGDYRLQLRWQLENAWTNTPQAADLTIYRWPGDIDVDADVDELLASAEKVAEQKLGFVTGARGEVELELTGVDDSFWVAMVFHPTNSDPTSSQADSGPVAYKFNPERSDLIGPMGAEFKEYTSEQRRILFNGPPAPDESDADLRRRVTELIERFATLAFRRPIDSPTRDRLVDVAMDIAGQPGKTYEDGIAAAVQLVLVSPRFLYRVEQAASPDLAGLAVPLDDYSLATRLSFFLTSGPPDENLLQIAREGRLHEEMDNWIGNVIDQEWLIREGVRQFVQQWLQTADVHNIDVDARRILGVSQSDADNMFNWRVRDAMRRETEMLFEHLIRENLPAERMLDADFTFLNKHLAQFYGIDGVRHDDMRKVQLPADSHRRGVLTHGAVLLVTSNPTRTSPVKRGLFVMENLLGTPAPPAPPNVPELEASKTGDLADASLRAVLERHRSDPACASCHQRMDPLGLAMENFDALGRYRDVDQTSRNEAKEDWWRKHRGQKDFPETDDLPPIDGSGTLMTGESFNGVEELATILATQRRRDFYRCLTEKWLTFALGRGMTYRDATAIDQIVDQLEADDGRMQTLVRAICHSVPFTHRRGIDQD